MSRAPPKRRCQSEYEMTATFGPPGTASSAVYVRPSNGFTPNVSNSAASVRDPDTCSGSVFASVAPSTNGHERNAAIGVRFFRLFCASTYRPVESGRFGPNASADGLLSHIITSREASTYGNGRSNTPSTTLNTAAAAPTPSPSVRTAATVKP